MTRQNRNRFTPELEMLESREVPSTFAYSSTDYSYYDTDFDADAYRVSDSANRSDAVNSLGQLSKVLNELTG